MPQGLPGGGGMGGFGIDWYIRKGTKKTYNLQRTSFSCFTSSPDLSMALAFLFLPTGGLGRPPPTPFTSSLSGEQGLEPAVPLPLLIFLVSSFLGICSFVKSSLSSSTHSSSRLLTKTKNRSYTIHSLAVSMKCIS